MKACSICGEAHNLGEHFRIQREKEAKPESVKVKPAINKISPVTNVTNGVQANRDRVSKWQKAHREEYNAKMRKHREKVKSNA